jgi:hypothetical protein
MLFSVELERENIPLLSKHIFPSESDRELPTAKL